MNNEKLAIKIYNHAVKELNCGLKIFSMDKEMIEMYLSDFKDTLKIALLVHDNKIQKAINKARDMDTSARDKIHEDFWKLIDND